MILSRPALEAGERLGFPAGRPEREDRSLSAARFMTRCSMCLGDAAGRLMEQGVIEVAPLAFMRGRTLSRAFVILDEAQNTTQAQMKMALTRLGEDSHMVVTGDRLAKRPAGRRGRGPERGPVLPGRRGRRRRHPFFRKRRGAPSPRRPHRGRL